MTLFTGSMLLCFLGAIALRNRPLRLQIALMCALALTLSAAYFFFNRI